MNWPGTSIRKSHHNDFTLSERLEHSCMWSKGEQKRAEELEKRIASASEREKQITAFRVVHLVGTSKK